MNESTPQDILVAHRGVKSNNGVDLWTECRCGTGERFYDPRFHGLHVLAELRAAGYAITKLPKPDSGEWHVQDIGTVSVWIAPKPLLPAPGVRIKDVGLDLVVSPAEARRFGRSLLAAADTAEAHDA